MPTAAKSTFIPHTDFKSQKKLQSLLTTPIPPLPQTMHLQLMGPEQACGPCAATPLTREQEALFWASYNAARKVGNEKRAAEWREFLTAQNMGLVGSTYARLRKELSRVPADECLSEGMAALLRAVDKFNCSHGWKFSTYATTAITRAILRLGTKQAKRDSHAKMLSLSGTSAGPTIAAPHEKPIFDTEDCEKVRRLVYAGGGLTSQEQHVIVRRFLSGRTTKFVEIAAEFGLSKTRIGHIYKTALAKLRSAMTPAC